MGKALSTACQNKIYFCLKPMSDTFQKIELLRSQLTDLPMSDKAKAELDKKFRLEFNYNSNHIEGNTLTYGETALLLIFDKTQGNHDYREFEEMKAHDVAFKLIQTWAIEIDRPLTGVDIKLLHQTILVRPSWKEAITPDRQPTRRLIEIGNYKKYPNSVRLESGEMFEYASVMDTPMLMGDLMRWLRETEQHDSLHPVELAARLHYKLVRIHPFDDGNGRISRLVMNYVLLKHGLPPVIIKSADKRQYLFALNQADAGNEAAFVDYIARQLVWSLELTLKAARGENIEEADDMEKEISIFKRQVTQKEQKLFQRNNAVIYELYEHSIQELFQQFEAKHSQFYELFNKSQFIEFKNNGGHGHNDWWLSELVKKDKNSLKNLQSDDINNLSIIVYLSEPRYGDKQSAVFQFKLMFEFHPSVYVIRYGNKVIEKRYGELLDAEQKQQIIAECVKFAFTQIKAALQN